MAMTKLERLCEEKGLKMTEQRRVIARVIADAEDHPDVETVYRRATAVDPRISIATVYRSLKLFDTSFDPEIFRINDFQSLISGKLFSAFATQHYVWRLFHHRPRC